MAAPQGYVPTPPPHQDDPKAQEIVQWAQREFESLANFFSNFSVLQQNVLHVEPSKPREGMKVVADGTDWDPGSGMGTYTYLGGTWVFESLQVDTSLFLTKAANLGDVANVTTSQQNLNLEPGVDIMAFDAQLTSNIRRLDKSANYTTILTDGEKFIFCLSGGITVTIAANASVAYPIGTAITVLNVSGSAVTLAINTDQLTWLPSLTTGSRTLAHGALATALKYDTAAWSLTGVGIS